MPLLDPSYRVEVAGQLTSSLDFSTPSAPMTRTYQQLLTEGVGLNQVNRLWHDQRTLAASANEDLDLAGVLTDPFGGTITNARIKGIVIKAAATNTNNVIVGGAATNAFINWVGAATHTLTVRPDGVFALFAPDAGGYAVTAGTGDLLRVANSGAGSSITYDIVLLGAAS